MLYTVAKLCVCVWVGVSNHLYVVCQYTTNRVLFWIELPLNHDPHFHITPIPIPISFYFRPYHYRHFFIHINIYSYSSSVPLSSSSSPPSSPFLLESFQHFREKRCIFSCPDGIKIKSILVTKLLIIIRIIIILIMRIIIIIMKK